MIDGTMAEKFHEADVTSTDTGLTSAHPPSRLEILASLKKRQPRCETRLSTTQKLLVAHTAPWVRGLNLISPTFNGAFSGIPAVDMVIALQNP